MTELQVQLQIVAMRTYGKEMMRDPHNKNGARLSAIKCTASVAHALLALYGASARDLTSKQASYHYLALKPLPSLRHNWLLFHLTEHELATVESHCRQAVFHWIYLWQSDHWCEFPSRDYPEFRDVRTFPTAGHPRFAPESAQCIRISALTADQKRADASDEESARSSESGSTIQAKRIRDWWWLSGDTYPHRELLKASGARWSRKRHQWYFVGDKLPESIVTLCATSDQPDKPDPTSADPLVNTSNHHSIVFEAHPLTPYDYMPPEQAGIASTGEAPKEGVGRRELVVVPKPKQDHATDPPLIQEKVESPLENKSSVPVRVIPPPPPIQLLAEDIGTSTARPGNASASHSNTPLPIRQQYVGEVTGSISGNVHCYGYGVHAGVCVYLNMGGPRTAVEAIRAKLAKGDMVNVVPWDAPAIELTAGEQQTGMYTAYLQSIPEARFTSVILVHEWISQPDFNGKSTTFLFRVDEMQAMAKLKHLVTELVSVAVFDTWTSYLWRAGQHAGLVRPTESGGGIDLLTISLDRDAWTELLAGGLAGKAISLPSTG
jgi:hypothetical protein